MDHIGIGKVKTGAALIAWHLYDDKKHAHSIFTELSMYGGLEPDDIISSVEIPIKYCPVCGKELK